MQQGGRIGQGTTMVGAVQAVRLYLVEMNRDSRTEHRVRPAMVHLWRDGFWCLPVGCCCVTRPSGSVLCSLYPPRRLL
jgi:hypothetical protein